MITFLRRKTWEAMSSLGTANELVLKLKTELEGVIWFMGGTLMDITCLEMWVTFLTGALARFMNSEHSIYGFRFT